MKNILIIFTLFWTFQSYSSVDSLVTGLNSLPVDRQIEAKIVPVNESLFYLIYKKDDGFKPTFFNKSLNVGGQIGA